MRSVSYPNARPVLREAKFDDFEGIVALESRYGLESKPYEEWTHLWVSNPVYPEVKSWWPIGWVLQGEHGKILGYAANIPLRYQIIGKKLLAATSRAWVVETEYRSHAPLLLDSQFRQKNVQLIVNATVSASSEQAYMQFNVSRAPRGAWDRSLFWIIEHRGFSESYLRMRSVPAARLLSYPIAAVLSVSDMIRNRSYPHQQIESCDDFDERFDAFWNQYTAQHPELLLADRSCETLRWHFCHALKDRAVWICVARDRDRLLAYSIFLKGTNPRFSLRNVRLIDFRCLRGSEGLLLPMLAWARERCRRERDHMLEYVAYSKPETYFDVLAPRYRKLPCWLFYYRAQDQELARLLNNPHAWDGSLYDGDASL